MNAPVCAWFALCGRPATTTQAHVILGDVPVCAKHKAFANGEPYDDSQHVDTVADDDDASPYAWVITHDYTDDGEPREGAGVGDMGPGARYGAPARTNADGDVDTAFYPLSRAFAMFDDDGILYLRGRLFWTRAIDVDGEPVTDTDEPLFSPLSDYGTPAYGAVRITYAGRPDWECG